MSDEVLCGREALSLVYWPGRDPLPMCPDHQAWAVKVAGSGLLMHLTTSKAEPGATCTQVLGRREIEERKTA